MLFFLMKVVSTVGRNSVSTHEKTFSTSFAELNLIYFFLLDGMLNHFMIRTPCFLIQQFCSMDSQTKRSRMAIVVSCQYNTVGVNNHIRINQFQMPDHDELQYKCMVCLGKLLTSKVIRS